MTKRIVAPGTGVVTKKLTRSLVDEHRDLDDAIMGSGAVLSDAVDEKTAKRRKASIKAELAKRAQGGDGLQHDDEAMRYAMERDWPVSSKAFA